MHGRLTDFGLLGATFITGVGLALLHDCWVCLLLGWDAGATRGRARRLPAWGSAGFWAVAVALTWLMLSYCVAGAVRGADFLGFAAGALAYGATLSRPARRLLSRFRRALAAFLGMALETVTGVALFPARLAAGALEGLMSWSAGLFGAPGRWALAGIERIVSGAEDLARGLPWRRGRQRPS
jgi:hypothetical protein